MARLAIIGSRGFSSPALVKQFISRLRSTTVVVSGAAPGVDRIAASYARERKLTVDEMPADWSLGKKAGPLRNTKLVNSVDGLMAFWDGSSPGTFDSIQKAVDRKIWTMVIYPSGKRVLLINSAGEAVNDLPGNTKGE